MAAEAWLLATRIAVVVLLLGLAGWLAWLDIRSRAVRAFCVFLLLRAGSTLALILESTAIDGSWNRAQHYYDIATPFALAWFLLLYPRESRYARWPALVGLTVSLVVLEAFVARDACNAICGAADGRAIVGPAGLLIGGVSLVSVVAGFVLARRALVEPSRIRGLSILLVCTALLVNGALDAGIFIAALAQSPNETWAAYVPSVWAAMTLGLPVAGGFVAAAALREIRRAPAFPRIAAWTGASFLTGIVVGTGPLPDATPIVVPLWRLVLPLIVGYALVRYRVFDVDAKATITLSRGTVGALFVGVFIIVTEVTANYVSDRLSSYFGIAAIGLLVIVFVPLQHVAERLVRRLVGEARPVARIPLEDRVEIYRTQVERAWRDGAPPPRERQFLVELREHLEIPDDVARQAAPEPSLSTSSKESPTA